MNLTIQIDGRVLVSGTCDAGGGAVVPHPDALLACSRLEVALVEMAHGLLGEMLGKAGAVTRGELRQVVRDEVREAVADTLRSGVAAGVRGTLAHVTY